jgi:hypothetical protein
LYKTIWEESNDATHVHILIRLLQSTMSTGNTDSPEEVQAEAAAAAAEAYSNLNAAAQGAVAVQFHCYYSISRSLLLQLNCSLDGKRF